MKKLDEEEKKEMRARVFSILESGLPSMIQMPVPSNIKSEPWFQESGAKDIVKIYALPSFKMNAFNGKLAPAFKACLMDEEAGKFDPDTIVIGASSSNWATEMGLLAPLFNFKEFHAVINTKSVPLGKQKHLQASGAKIISTPDGILPTDYVYELAKLPHYHLIDQYVHPGSVIGHKWTMDHITREIKRLESGQNLSFFSAVGGTCSTLRAAKEYLQPEFPNMEIWAVESMSKEEKVPGSRYPESVDELKGIGGGFDYKTAINGGFITGVTKDEAFRVNAELVKQYFITSGPTGALLLAGVWHHLGDYFKEHGNFEALKNNNGIVLGAIFIMDMHLPYLDDDEYRKYFM